MVNQAVVKGTLALETESSFEHDHESQSCDASSSLSEVERRARARERMQLSKLKEKKDDDQNCCTKALAKCCSSSCGWLYEASSVCVGASAWRKQWADYEERLLSIREETLFLVHGKTYHFSKTSFGLLENKNRLRIACVWLITSRWFESGVTMLIMINSLLLGLKDYTDTENKSGINQFIEAGEPFFTAFFVIECLAKTTAQGIIFGKNCYLDDAWNWLDFLVVVTSLLVAIPSL